MHRNGDIINNAVMGIKVTTFVFQSGHLGQEGGGDSRE